MKKKISVLFLFLISLFLINVFTNETENESAGTEAQSYDKWSLRSEFKKDGKVLLQVFPDPTLHAGKPFGYIFHFKEPLEVYEGKKLAIYAFPKQMGEKITIFSPETIKRPSSGYPALDRFPVIFEVPRGGLWRYEVFLDDKFYADVVFLVKGQEK